MPKLVPIHYTTLVQVFEYFGLKVARKKGDHIMMTKEGISRPVVIKTSPRKVSVSHIRTNLNTARISRAEYFDALAKL